MSEAVATETTQQQPTMPSLEGLLQGLEKKPEAQAVAPEDASKPKEVLEKSPESSDPKFASKFAALSHKERKLQDMQAKLKEQMKALETEKLSLSELQTLKAKAKENPLEWLKGGGLEYDDLVKYMLGGEKVPAESLVKQTDARVKALEEKLAAYEQEKVTAQEEKAISSFKNDIKEKVTASEEYELIRAFESYDTVYNVIEQHYTDTGKVLSIDEAAELVEAHLTQEVEEGVKKISSTKKLSQKLGFLKQEAPKTLEAPKLSQPAKTLTNSLAQESVAPISHALSDEERKREAMKLLRFTDE